MVVKTGRKWAETVRNGGRLCWKPRFTRDCNAEKENWLNNNNNNNNNNNGY